MWRIQIDKQHVMLWLRWLKAWLAFVGVALVFGWHLKPRMDEVVFILLLPVPVVAVYALGCLAIAALKALWTIGPQRVGLRLRWNRSR